MYSWENLVFWDPKLVLRGRLDIRQISCLQRQKAAEAYNLWHADHMKKGTYVKGELVLIANEILKNQQVLDPHISSYSAQIRKYVPLLKSCESEESSRDVYRRIGDHFHVAKIEKIVKEGIHHGILCSGTQNRSWEAGWISDKYPAYTTYVVSNVSPRCHTWVMDSGCSHHMTPTCDNCNVVGRIFVWYPAHLAEQVLAPKTR